MSRQSKQRNKRHERELALWEHDAKGTRLARKKNPSPPFTHSKRSKQR